MNPVELQFRTATLGGFHKQDVLDYIDLMTREQAGRLEAAERERDDAVRERDTLEEQSAAMREAQAALEAKFAQRDKRAAELETLLSQAQADLRQEQARREDLEMQVLELEERLSKAEPAAQAYESVKDRTAGIELEAYHRAKLVEKAAQQKIQVMKGELQAWVQTSRTAYSQLRAEIDETAARATSELEQLQQRMQGLGGIFLDQDAALELMMDQFQQTLDAPKADAPATAAGSSEAAGAKKG